MELVLFLIMKSNVGKNFFKMDLNCIMEFYMIIIIWKFIQVNYQILSQKLEKILSYLMKIGIKYIKVILLIINIMERVYYIIPILIEFILKVFLKKVIL